MVDGSMSDYCSRCGAEDAYYHDPQGNPLCDNCYQDFLQNSCYRCRAEPAYNYDDEGHRLCDECYDKFVHAKADERADEARNEVLRQYGKGQSGGGGCFIATAAYGTPLAEEIGILRRFRDNELQPDRFGRHLITLYYETSPYLARVIARSERMRAFVRLNLKPIVRYFESRNNQY